MAVRTSTLSPPQTRRSNHRASLSFLFGLISAVVIPAAVELTRRISGVALLEAAWAIPVAAVAATGSLLFARGGRGKIARTLEQAGGSIRLRLGRILAVAGISFTLSASLAVGLYELLLRLEH